MRTLSLSLFLVRRHLCVSKADVIKERSFVSADDGGEHVVETSSLNTREIKEKIESWILQSDSIHADARQPTNQILSCEA